MLLGKKGKIYNFTKSLLYLFFSPIRLIINETTIKLIYPDFHYKRNRIGKKYVSFTFREKLPTTRDNLKKVHDSFGIVIQGPVSDFSYFTLKTIEYYLEQFPGLKVILSTWEDRNLKKFEKINGLIIINNSKEINNLDTLDLTTNMNFQIISSYNGLLRLKELGVEYAVKSRTDIRLYNNDLFHYLKNLSDFYDNNIKRRIILLDQNSKPTKPFWLDDTFQFGLLDDLIEFWSVKKIYKYPDDNYNYMKIKNAFNLETIRQPYPFINYIVSNFGWEVFDSLGDDYLELAVNYFIIIPRSIIESYWIKYQRKDNFSLRTSYDIAFKEYLSSSDWLNYELKRIKKN